MDAIAQILYHRIEEAGCRGHTLTLKVKYADYRQVIRAQTFDDCIDSYQMIKSIGRELLVSNIEENQPMRLLGLTVSNLGGQESGPKQLSLDLQIPELVVQRRW
ncbi:MAG: hypothetical protein WA902_06115 [Thermosynechococcaceae cyanobacterium]